MTLFHITAESLWCSVYLVSTGTLSSQIRAQMNGEWGEAKGVLWPLLSGGPGKQADAEDLFQMQKKNITITIRQLRQSRIHQTGTLCPNTISVALWKSHTTSSLSQQSHTDMGWSNKCNGTWSLKAIHSAISSPPHSELCIIFFKNMQCGQPSSVLSYTSLFPGCCVRGRHINHTHTH